MVGRGREVAERSHIFASMQVTEAMEADQAEKETVLTQKTKQEQRDAEGLWGGSTVGGTTEKQLRLYRGVKDDLGGVPSLGCPRSEAMAHWLGEQCFL